VVKGNSILVVDFEFFSEWKGKDKVFITVVVAFYMKNVALMFIAVMLRDCDMCVNLWIIPMASGVVSLVSKEA